MNPAPALQVVDLHKTFGAFRALDGVSLSVRAGTVHALLGENGAGKSTLVKCVMGYHRADGGRILVDGQEVTVASPRHAAALGLGMVYQHFTLVPNMTVAENLLLARPGIPFVIDWRRERSGLEAFMATVPFPLPLAAPVRTLSAGERQKLEICKQLYLRSRIVILDEPTAVLTPGEADEVLGLLRRLTRDKEKTVLLITHKFREVQSFADEVTVLRRGAVHGRGEVSALTAAAMAQVVVGRAPTTPTSAPAANVGAPRLRVDDLWADDDRGAPACKGVSLDVRAGEIVGVAAVAGNGQEALVEVLGGQRPARAGRVVVDGQDYTPTRDEMRARGVRCLPEEPLRNACVATMSVAENIALRDFDRPPLTVLRWGVSRARLVARAREAIAAFGVRTRSPDVPIGTLSGGNVQRAVLARELSSPARVLIVANPCMGLDFRAVEEIHARLRAARDAGAAVLLVSADLDELLTLADRLLVMSGGVVAYESPRATADLAVIGQRMAGHRHAA